MKTLIVNMKNYREVLGEGALKLGEAAAAAASQTKAEVIVAPPTPMLGLVAVGTGARVFGQSAVPSEAGRSTGAVLLEALKAAGASGVILNHSEAPLPLKEVAALVRRAAALEMKTCVCAGGSAKAARLSRLAPDYLAVEPPELIGSGVAVSRAKPGVITGTVAAARRAGYEGRVLCGAGITSGADVAKAVELGAQGVMVSSSVVKAADWTAKVAELATALG